jgi:hypothetical protein
MKAPKISLTGGGIVALVALAGVIYLGYELYKNKNKILGWFNPADPNNLANQSVTAVLKDTGVIKQNASIGTSFYDWLNGSNQYQYGPGSPTTPSTPPLTVGTP